MNKMVLIIVGVLALVGVVIFASGNLGGNKGPFPTPNGVKNFTSTGENAVNFQTSMSLSDVEEFYRSELNAQGMSEREGLTVTSDTTLSFVFDGHSSGIPLVVQAVALDNSTTNVNIRLEAL